MLIPKCSPKGSFFELLPFSAERTHPGLKIARNNMEANQGKPELSGLLDPKKSGGDWNDSLAESGVVQTWVTLSVLREPQQAK